MGKAKTIALILLSLTALHGCKAVRGLAAGDSGIKTRKVWADRGYSSPIHHVPTDEVLYSPEDFATTLATMDLGDGAYVYVLQSATLTVSFPKDDEEIDGWLEFRSGTDGQTHVHWTGIEARKPALSANLSKSQARRIFKRASRVLHDDSGAVHDQLTGSE